MIKSDKNKALTWVADILPGFEQAVFALDDSHESTLVRRRSSESTGAAVLYVHGFTDYFFQSHLADLYNAQGLHFYALDLRRHGRSMRNGQLPNFTQNLDEYFQDIDFAINTLQQQEQVNWLLLNGHSTGGLLVALYRHRGQQREQINAIFLNSPFLDMNLPTWKAWIGEPILAWLGKWFPRLPCPGLSHWYGMSVHADYHGQWHFNTTWKPIAGFPVYAGWIRAIHRAQAEVARGLNIECPCLVVHAQRSLRPKVWTDEILTADVVLNVADIQRLAPGLGHQVEIHAIANAVHDVTLSAEASREQLWAILGDWLERVRAEPDRHQQ